MLFEDGSLSHESLLYDDCDCVDNFLYVAIVGVVLVVVVDGQLGGPSFVSSGVIKRSAIMPLSV